MKKRLGSFAALGFNRQGRTGDGFTIVELLIVVVVIAILAAITIVSYNGITNKARESVMASDISTWKKKSELYKAERDIICPEGYVFVYGNSTLGTSDFCVMKYEAKNVNGVAVSQPGGTAWVDIDHADSIAAAATSCEGCHLISEAEWMTIAADVLSVKYNWSSGNVGEGFIYSGHNDSSPANPVNASSDDGDGYFNTGNSKSSGATQKRTLYLSSGDVVWDLAGNLWERTAGSITGAQPGLPSDSSNADNYSVKEWNASGMTWGVMPTVSRPSSISGVPGLSQISSWGGSSGLGALFSNRNQTTPRVFLRGGHSGDGAQFAGILALTLSAAPHESLPIIGFRSAKSY